MAVVQIVTILAAILNSAWSAVDPSVANLKFVHVLWRHGDRTPSNPTFPTDIYNNVSTWPQGWGELTTIGMKQQYDLGQYFRRRYVDTGFLSSDYNAFEIYVRSTDYNRTLMSAMSNLAGMFPTNNESSFMGNMPWQPIPIHTMPKYDDPLLWMDDPCPTVESIYANEVLKSDAVKAIEEENKDLFNFLREATGLPLPTLDDVWGVFDALNCEFCHNDTHQWPSWMNMTLFNKITELYDLSVGFYYSEPRIKRLRGGMLFGEIGNRMLQKANKSPDLQPSDMKYYIYSAHDTTVTGLLENLGIYDGHAPDYATAIIIELRQDPDGTFYVQTYYLNETDSQTPHLRTIAGCEQNCALDKFVALARKQTPDDWKAECGFPKTENSDSLNAWKIAVGVLGATTGLSTLLFIVFAFLYCRQLR